MCLMKLSEEKKRNYKMIFKFINSQEAKIN